MTARLPLHRACSRHGTTVTALILLAATVLVACERPRMPVSLQEAARGGDLAAMQRQLDEGADPNSADDQGVTPLLAALFAEQSEAAMFLLANGADGRASSSVASEVLASLGASIGPGLRVETTPLFAAAFMGDAAVASRLVEIGADPRSADDEGFTALHLAAQRGHREVCAILVDRGADVRARTHDGDTPLSFAVAAGHVGTVAELLEIGARASATIGDLSAALQVAMDRQDEAMVRVLQRYVSASEGPSVRAIDTTGADPFTTAIADALTPLLPGRIEPRGIAVDVEGERVYWAEYGADRIRSMDLKGRDTRTVVEDVDGPIGVAVDAEARAVYWTADASYPRRVCRAGLDGTSIVTLVGGAPVNRPRAIAIDRRRGELLWTEAVSGRVLRSGLDGRGIVEIFTSGISSIADRPDRRAFRSLGLTVSGRSGRLYWTELATSRIQTVARIAGDTGGEPKTHDLFTAVDGIDFPAGIVVHDEQNVLYWTDLGRRAILRASIDGGDVVEILGPQDGLIEPYGIAIEPVRSKLYWTDASRDVIARANLDGSALEERSLHDEEPFAPPRESRTCELAVTEAGRRYLAAAVAGVAVCLEKVDALKAVKRDASDAANAVSTCVGGLRRWNPLLRELHDTLEAECDGSKWHDPRVSRGNVLASSCAAAFADAADEAWLQCTVRRHGEAAQSLIKRRYVRALEWLEEVRPFIAASASAEGADGPAAEALAVLDELQKAFVPTSVETVVADYLPVTGQTTSYAAVNASGSGEMMPVADDGGVRAGRSRTFRDNGDGTVTDSGTGLTWEKKCAGCGGLHDFAIDLRWSGTGEETTIWDWLASVNAEAGTGFAGHSDWRIPNVKELQSLIDYERFNPAVGSVFDGDSCGLGCSDLTQPQCSCTRMSAYWSSTTAAGSPSFALDVAFHLGLIGSRPKGEFAHVRAVRGGSPAIGAVFPR